MAFSDHHMTQMSHARRHTVAGWLFMVAGFVFFMVVLGGATRLTHSGLSMVEWKPLTGWLPPMNEADWLALFERYQQSPEFQKVNFDMDLHGFKSIFWLEFIHRVWGRLIGLVFFIPFVFFVLRGWVSSSLAKRLGALFILGGLQGLMGWYMVKSGLVDRPDVSQYRLTAHLGLALIIIVALVRTGLAVLYPQVDGRGSSELGRSARWLLGVVLLTALSGGFVAGLDAGFTFNTFPLMDGQLVPDGLYAYSPWYLSPFEDIMTIQFNHRVLAELTLLAIVAFWWRSRTVVLSLRGRRAVNGLALMGLVQVLLGISTLLLVVPVSLGVLHQAGAVVLLMLATWVAFELRPGDTPSIV